ncbi:MAG: SulP family inorganic anion transporter [Candidatus Marsarchaeota archaeon]|nr:SulP family inorganic anion transporter [Candidatus Marsarchaeota archaeon]
MKSEERDLALPVLQGMLPIKSSEMPANIIAGISLAALAVPEVMGYTQIAGTPVITGLYTMLIPMGLYALFGSSRHLVVGADSATAAMLASGLSGLAVSGSAEYVALTGVLAFMAAAFLIIARVVGLGLLADFLSRTVLVGFLTGVGVQVSLGEISRLIGIPSAGSNLATRLLDSLQHIGDANVMNLAIGLTVLAIIVALKMVSKKPPGALIAVIGAVVASWSLDLQSHGVSTVGSVPGGLPRLGLPDVHLTWNLVWNLLPLAFSIFVVILAQSAATSRAFAARYDERFSENLDLIGLSFANLGAGLSGTFVVNGSPTKTQMVDSAGGSSQVAQIVTSLIVLLVLLFLTGPLEYLPKAALSAIVFLIGVELIDVRGMRRIHAQAPVEFWVALLTAAVVVFTGVEQGIVFAMALSLIAHTRHGYRPKNGVLVPDSLNVWRTLPVTSPVQAVPGLLVYRFTHSMYYANTEWFFQQVLDLVKGAQPPLSWFCIEASGVDDVDFSAAATLRSTHEMLKGQGIKLVFAEISEKVKAKLDRYELTDLVGKDAFFATVEELVNAYNQDRGKAST